MYDVSALVTPLLTVITPISFDHMELLAPKSGSIEEVAYAKSGSIKEGIPCIVGKQTYREALEILIDQAEHKRAPLLIYDRDWIVYEEKEEIVYEDNQNKFQFKNFKYHPTYQVENLGLAIATVSQIPNINIDGFLESNLHEKTEIIGRFQKIEDLKINSLANNDVEIIYDGGHNSAAGAGIYKSIEKLDKKPLCIVLGMISSKNPEDFISQFDQIECIRTITIQNEESAITAEDLKHKVNKFCDDTDTSTSINEAVKSISSKHSNARILITGSFYMAKEVFN